MSVKGKKYLNRDFESILEFLVLYGRETVCKMLHQCLGIPAASEMTNGTMAAMYLSEKRRENAFQL